MVYFYCILLHISIKKCMYLWVLSVPKIVGLSLRTKSVVVIVQECCLHCVETGRCPVLRPVLPFYPKYCLGHPENYFLYLSKNIFIRTKYPKTNKFNFEKKNTARDYKCLLTIRMCPSPKNRANHQNCRKFY